MTSLSEQVAMNETAIATIRSENESLTAKNLLANSEIARLAADNDALRARLEIYISATSKMQTLIDSAGVLLIEGKKQGNALQGVEPPKARSKSQIINEVISEMKEPTNDASAA